MKTSRIRYILLIFIVVAIIFFAGSYQLPKYTSRLMALAGLAIVDMLYWFPVRKTFGIWSKKILSILYWAPMCLLLMFFIAGIIIPYSEWMPFLRIYFPGILMILLIGKGILLLILISCDILLLPWNIIQGNLKKKKSKVFGWYRLRFVILIGTALASVVILVFISGMFFWVRDYKLNTVEIPVKDLPGAFEGYKVIQLSDIHLGSFLTTEPLKNIIKIVNEQHPDLILFTGDLVNFTTSEALPFEFEMKRFSAKDGIFSILGNHDYGDYSQWDTQEAKSLNDKALFGFYKRIGWQLLRNQNAIFTRDSTSIALIGVENWSISKRFGKKGDLKKAVSGTEGTLFKILMSHDPSHWDGEVNIKYPQIGLTLSGHTHAFQLAVESGSVKWSPASLLFKEWAGLYVKTHENGETQYLYVNRGAGTLGYPGRILARPEITLFILRRSN